MRLACVVSVVALWCIACLAPTVETVRRPRAGAVEIRIACEVDDAEVWINDQIYGTVSRVRDGLYTGPGDVRIEVRHPGYHSYYQHLVLKAGARVDVRAELLRRLQ